jgi:hypothetical protein
MEAVQGRIRSFRSIKHGTSTRHPNGDIFGKVLEI